MSKTTVYLTYLRTNLRQALKTRHNNHPHFNKVANSILIEDLIAAYRKAVK